MRLRLIYFAAFAILLITGCDSKQDPSVSSFPTQKRQSLADARRGFTTKLIRQQTVDESVAKPPPTLFRAVSYQSPIGEMAAYVSTSPGDGQKHPAIIWIVGGFANSVSEIAWQPGPPENDQSASAFRKAGIIVMYPSLRGGNKNAGFLEGFYGEVDDILAAADFLEKQDYVAPERIYLGGHSTGGTLALLVAESSDRFRAVFSFGPVGKCEPSLKDAKPELRCQFERLGHFAFDADSATGMLVFIARLHSRMLARRKRRSDSSLLQPCAQKSSLPQ